MTIKGGDWFIDAASWIAKITGMPEVLIGATIVSLGTTLPELMVSTTSSIQGHGGMALGNAIGSLICNIGLILGVCNVISPSKTDSRSYTTKAVLMIIYTGALLVMCLDGMVGTMDTIILLIGLCFYIYINIKEINTMQRSIIKGRTSRPTSIPKKEIAINLLQFIFGAVFIVVGARLLVSNGVLIASILEVPDVVISLTLLALGTSLPELVTSISALLKGHRDLSVGNIIGANILDIVMAIGISSIFHPLAVPPQTIRLDLPMALILMAALLIPSILMKKISRLHAAVLLLLYGIYITNLLF